MLDHFQQLSKQVSFSQSFTILRRFYSLVWKRQPYECDSQINQYKGLPAATRPAISPAAATSTFQQSHDFLYFLIFSATLFTAPSLD
jgi:hypothetical protein